MQKTIQGQVRGKAVIQPVKRGDDTERGGRRSASGALKTGGGRSSLPKRGRGIKKARILGRRITDAGPQSPKPKEVVIRRKL